MSPTPPDRDVIVHTGLSLAGLAWVLFNLWLMSLELD